MGNKFESFDNPEAAHDEAKAMEGVMEDAAMDGAEIGYETASKIRDLENLLSSVADDLETTLGKTARSGVRRFDIKQLSPQTGEPAIRYSLNSIHEYPADDDMSVDFDYAPGEGDYGSAEIVVKFGADGKPVYEITGDIDEKDKEIIKGVFEKAVNKEKG